MLPVNVSLFDLDSTLYKGQQGYVILDFPNFMQAHGLFNRHDLEQLEKLKRRYRDGDLRGRCRCFVLEVIETYYHGLTGQSVHEIELAAQGFWLEGPKPMWFPYASDLVALMHKLTMTILISGSPIEPLRYVQKQFDFAELHATTGCIEQGIYTGYYRKEDERATAEAKEKLIRSLTRRLRFDPDTSFAFGDSESDMPLFEAVNPQNSFVLGAREELLGPARAKAWNVLGYKDDVVGAVRARVLEVFPHMHRLV